jgi:hypothetical protein
MRRWVAVLWRGYDGGKREGGEWVYGAVEEMRKKENSDLKLGHVRPKYECVRTYVGAFDSIHAECVCTKWALCSNVQVAFERMRA